MIKIISLFILLAFPFSFEVEEQLSIIELEEEAQLFILNASYLDAISNYEKIYDIQSLIFGSIRCTNRTICISSIQS